MHGPGLSATDRWGLLGSLSACLPGAFCLESYLKPVLYTPGMFPSLLRSIP